MNREELMERLDLLDRCFVQRERTLSALNEKYVKNGEISRSDSEIFYRERNAADQAFEESKKRFGKDMMAAFGEIRKKQPRLGRLKASDANVGGLFPDEIALGTYQIDNLPDEEGNSYSITRTFPFPFKKPMICSQDKIGLLCKVLLRLMYALPTDKQEYYIFDPIGLGESFWNFNCLFGNEKLFPQKKIMTSASELKNALSEVMDYMQHFFTSIADAGKGCYDWKSYNKWLCDGDDSDPERNRNKMIPYKIFVLFDVPNGMDEECFSMFKKLIRHSERCGLLVLFSYDPTAVQMNQNSYDNRKLQLLECIKDSEKLHDIIDDENDHVVQTGQPSVPETAQPVHKYMSRFRMLNIKIVGEKFPSDKELNVMLKEFSQVVTENDTKLSFDDMLSPGSLFSSDACDGMQIPCGTATATNKMLCLDIGDATAHYLVGGATGSGKSNLLHNIIMSAGWKYDPNELRLYLLDFKEGVEFSKYVDTPDSPLLLHAALVATEADTEYGISVLAHLLQEKTERYRIFKENSCKDIKAYRQKNPKAYMPRILVVIDEFQVLFDSPEREQTIKSLQVLAKQGRACGIHLLLATQSLKGLDFGTLAPQFGGRIALKCSADDSKLLLGGAASLNEEAATLKIPYGILNVSEGSKFGNIKFEIPEAKAEIIDEKIKVIYKKGKDMRISPPKIFNGQEFPAFDENKFEPYESGFIYTLGERMDYDASRFNLTFRQSAENNLLFCGYDEQMKTGFLRGLMYSVKGSGEYDGIIYVGENEITDFGSGINIEYFPDSAQFAEAYKDNLFEKKHIVVLDNCNIKKETGYEASSYARLSETGETMKKLLEDGNKNGTFIIAFYDGWNRIRNWGIPYAMFKYRIGYSLNANEMTSLLENSVVVTKNMKKGRAFLANNLVVEAWIRPFKIKNK